MQGQVQRSAQALRAGGWEGRGSAAFFAEMDDEIAPALQRLTSALRQAQDVNGQINRLLRQAEEEAAEPFRGDSIYTIICYHAITKKYQKVIRESAFLAH